jgi:hypothetical protein
VSTAGHIGWFLFCMSITLGASAQPPAQVELRGERSMATTEEAPNHAFYTLHNHGDRAVRVRLVAAVLRWDGHEQRLRIDLVVTRAGDRSLSTDLQLAPGQSIELEVSFTGIPADADRGNAWSFELRAEVEGNTTALTATAHAVRGTRHPVRP